MDFRVPPDCKDSPFHYKWRLHMLEHVKKEQFWRQDERVRSAVKTFLDHPTSLPYEHQKVLNFMANSMIIVDREVLDWALDWFKDVRISFMASVKCGFIPAAEVPYTPPPKPNAQGAEENASGASSASSLDSAKNYEPDAKPGSKVGSNPGSKVGAEAEKGLEAEPKAKQAKFENLMLFPAKWLFNHAIRHVLSMRENVDPDKITRINKCVAKIEFDSEDEMIALLNEDAKAVISMNGKLRPRLYLQKVSLESLNVVTVESTDEDVKYHRDLVPALKDQLGTQVRTINMFHEWDGFFVILETAEAVEALIQRNIKSLSIAGKNYPVAMLKGIH